MTSNILSSPETWTPNRDGVDYRYLAGAKHDIVARLPFDPTASVLEIGCGRGETGALALAQKRVRRYVGIEALPERAARAQGMVVSPLKVFDEVTLSLAAHASPISDAKAAKFFCAPLLTVSGFIRNESSTLARSVLAKSWAFGCSEAKRLRSAPTSFACSTWYCPLALS